MTNILLTSLGIQNFPDSITPDMGELLTSALQSSSRSSGAITTNTSRMTGNPMLNVIFVLIIITAVIFAIRFIPVYLKNKAKKTVLEGYKKILPNMTEYQVKHIMGTDYYDSFNEDGTFSYKWRIVNKGKMSFASSNGVLGGINGFRDGSASITSGETIEILIFFNKEGHVTDKRIINI